MRASTSAILGFALIDIVMFVCVFLFLHFLCHLDTDTLIIAMASAFFGYFNGFQTGGYIRRVMERDETRY